MSQIINLDTGELEDIQEASSIAPTPTVTPTESQVIDLSTGNLITAQEHPQGQGEELLFTGKKTGEGRPIYKNQAGDFVTERTITENIPELGGFVNVPTVFNGQFLSPDEAINKVIQAGGKDPVTGRPLEVFQDVNAAVNAAQDRSEDLGKQIGLPEGSALSAITEPALAIGSGIAGEIAGGLAGGVTALFSDAEEGAKVIESVRGAAREFGEPETQRGQEALATVGDIMQKGIDIARFPLSGLAGLGELIAGQGVEQAAQTIKDVQEKGFGPTVGSRIFEETGDPLLATIGETSPEILGALIPVTKAVKTRIGVRAKLADQVKASRSNPQLSIEVKDFSNKLPELSSDPAVLTKEVNRIENVIRENQGNAIADKFKKTANEVIEGDDLAINDISKIADDIGEVKTGRSLGQYIVDGSGKLKTDSLSKDAITQGFDSGVISGVNGSTRIDKNKMLQMVDVVKKGKEDPLYAIDHRPGDIAGGTLLERINYVRKVNGDAAKELKSAANELKGNNIDATKPIANFANSLDEMGINFDSSGKIKFKGSDIDSRNLRSSQLAITEMVDRIKDITKTGGTDAYELHRLKRLIDEQVTFGKPGEGLSGRVDGILKKLRRDINTTLGKDFSRYKEVNTTYSDTIDALDSLQSAAGKKVDLTGSYADKALGKVANKLMSNYASRENAMAAFDDIDSVAKKYGGVFDDNLNMQILFADELEKLFKAAPRKSFVSGISRGTEQGIEAAAGRETIAGLGIKAAKYGAEKLRGINEENAFKSISELLKRE